MRHIGIEERRARLALRHHLALSAADVDEAARSLIGFHSSDPATVYLSARARVPGAKQDDLDAALYERRSLVRILAVRRTMFVVPVDLAPVLHNSSTIALIASERKRLAKMLEDAGITDDGQTWIERVGDLTITALRKRGQALATELSEDVPELAEKLVFYRKDGTVFATVGVVTRMLFLLATEGRVVRARPRGSWVSGQYRWSAMEDWIGRPLDGMAQSEAEARLLELWLRSFGPASEVDMRWWTGWAANRVRRALAAIGAVEVEVESGPAYVMGDDLEPVDNPPHWVALLPGLDSTTMGWKDREWYLGPHQPRLFDRNGNAGQTIWVDGRVVGGWAQRPDGAVVWELLEDVGSETRAEIRRQAEELTIWTGGKSVIPRFRSPSDIALAGRERGAEPL